MTTYKFVDNFDPSEEEITSNFLQIAEFMHPKTKHHHVRKFTINQSNEVINMKDYYLNKSKYERLLKKKKPNEYKLYSVYSLNDVNHPNASHILAMKSSILQTNHDYYGFAPF